MFNERFKLQLVAHKVTSLEDELREFGYQLYASSKQIHVVFTELSARQATIGVYDISGRLIGSYENKDALDVRVPVEQAGIYIVKVKNAHGVLSKKLFVKQ